MQGVCHTVLSNLVHSLIFWPLTNSDFLIYQTFRQFHDLDTELDLHRSMSGFHGAFVTVVACQQRTLTLPDTLFRPKLFGDLLVLQLLRPDSSNLPCLYSTFHLEYPLVLSLDFCSYCSQYMFAEFWSVLENFITDYSNEDIDIMDIFHSFHSLVSRLKIQNKLYFLFEEKIIFKSLMSLFLWSINHQYEKKTNLKS